MATQMFTGAGQIQIRDNTNGVLFAGGYAGITIESSSDTQSARRFTQAGKLVISDSYNNNEEYTLTVNQEVVDSLHLGLAMGEIPAQASSVNYYECIEATIPASSPYEIAVPALITTALGNASSVLVSLFASGTWNAYTTGQKKLNLTPNASTPLDGEFQVNTTSVGSEKIVFNSAQAGGTVVISYLKTATNKLTVGYSQSAVKIGSAYFSAKLVSDEFPNGCLLICPSISKSSGFNYATDDVPVVENVFTIGTAAGFTNPFHFVAL